MIPDDAFYNANGELLSCRALGKKLGISKSAANRLIAKFKARQNLFDEEDELPGKIEESVDVDTDKYRVTLTEDDYVDMVATDPVGVKRLIGALEESDEPKPKQPKKQFEVKMPKRAHRNIIILNDIHFPYHDEDILESVMHYIYDSQVDMVILNGDTLDCEALSTFQDSDRASFSEELDLARSFIKQLTKIARHNNSDCEFVWIDGNHEARLEKYLIRQAPELLGLSVEGNKVLSIRNLMGLDELGWQYLSYSEFLALPGDLYIQHGHKVSKHSSSSVGNSMRDQGGSVIIGHVHRLGAFYVTNRLGTFRGFENGCLCRQPKYLPKDSANWQRGFCKVTYTDETTWHVQQAFIQNGKFMMDGKLYGA